MRLACGLALRGRCWSASGEPFRFSGALWPLTLCGDCAYSAGCWPATCTRREFPEWNDFPQCLQRARLNTRFVAVDVGEQRTCRRCSRKPRLVKNRLQCGHCASFGDFLICCQQQFPVSHSGATADWRHQYRRSHSIYTWDSAHTGEFSSRHGAIPICTCLLNGLRGSGLS